MTDCKYKKCLIAIAGVFVFLYAFDWVWHGILFMGMYEDTAQMWRPFEEMGSYMGYCFLYHLSLATLYTFGYSYIRKLDPNSATGMLFTSACPCRHGAKYGLFLGLLLGISSASAYIHLPIPGSMAIMWLVGYTLQGVGAGMVLGGFYIWKKKCERKAAA